MKIHEYQGKSILKKFNIPIQDGYTIQNINNAVEIIKKVQYDFKTEDVVVKAQIHAGGRGKGGGVKYCPDFTSALENTKNILGCGILSKLRKSLNINDLRRAGPRKSLIFNDLGPRAARRCKCLIFKDL